MLEVTRHVIERYNERCNKNGNELFIKALLQLNEWKPFGNRKDHYLIGGIEWVIVKNKENDVVITCLGKPDFVKNFSINEFLKHKKPISKYFWLNGNRCHQKTKAKQLHYIPLDEIECDEEFMG